MVDQVSQQLALPLTGQTSKHVPGRSYSDRKPGAERTGVHRAGRMSMSYSLDFRYLKQILDLPAPGLPQMNLLETYSLKDEMGSLR